MKIESTSKFIESYLQHRLDPRITVEQIAAALPDVKDEGGSWDGKAEHRWTFLADGQECAVWDYRELRWSAFGPREVFDALGLPVIGGYQDIGLALELAREVGQ